MTTKTRRPREEVLELLHDKNWRDSVAGWVVFDRVDDEWKFMATTSGDWTFNSDCEYTPSIEALDSTLKTYMNDGHRMAGLVQNYNNGEKMLFFLPVGDIYYTD